MTRSAYGYVAGSPLNQTDPSGLWCVVRNDDGGCKGAGWIRKHADDLSNAAGAVAATCGVMAVVTSATILGGIGFGSCAAAASSVSVGSSLLHSAVTCADLDETCGKSLVASGINLMTLGVGGMIGSADDISRSMIYGTDAEALRGLGRWYVFTNIAFFGWGACLEIDTTERDGG
jgi:hypothetical protein